MVRFEANWAFLNRFSPLVTSELWKFPPPHPSLSSPLSPNFPVNYTSLPPTFRYTPKAFPPRFGPLMKLFHLPVYFKRLKPTFQSTPPACNRLSDPPPTLALPVLFGPLLHLWALSTTRHMRWKQHLRLVSWRETIMLVVLDLYSDVNGSRQSTIHVTQL